MGVKERSAAADFYKINSRYLLCRYSPLVTSVMFPTSTSNAQVGLCKNLQLYIFVFCELSNSPTYILLANNNALPLGRAYGLYDYAAKALQHLTALFIMIAHLAGISKEMIYLHDFAERHI